MGILWGGGSQRPRKLFNPKFGAEVKHLMKSQWKTGIEKYLTEHKLISEVVYHCSIFV